VVSKEMAFLGFRKRRSTFANNRYFNRRRYRPYDGKFIGRRRYTGKCNTAFDDGRQNSFVATQQHGGLSNLSYKGRKMGLKNWRNELYKNTQFMAHYRSVFLGQDTYQTGTTQGSAVPVRYLPELGTSTSVGFWTAAGGLQNLDRDVSPPDFLGDITIRGGIIGLNVTVADSVTDLIAVSVYLTFIKSGTRDPFNYINGTEPYNWDPQVQPDSSAGGWKVLKKWTAMLNYNNPSLAVEHRLKPRKIDRALYLLNAVDFQSTPSNQFCFVVHACNLTSGTDVGIVVHRTHNMSFSADADTVV